MPPVCVILGAGPGIGSAVAAKFIERGYHVALLARNARRLNAVAEKLEEGATSIWTVNATDHAALGEVFAKIAAEIGAPEVFVFNAYILDPGLPTSVTSDRLERSLKLNVVSPLVAAQLMVPLMAADKKRTIIFTGGGLAVHPTAEKTSLSIGKAGLRALTFCLNQELKQTGVHACTVTVCGMVAPDTPFDPDVIADSYVALHDQSMEQAEAEIMFTGKS